MTFKYDGFEWDENKNQENRRKHKLDFKTVTKIFDDPFFKDRFDSKNSTLNEMRRLGIGMLYERYLLITVSYTMRGDTVRIISARGSNQSEKEEYYADH